MLLQLRKERDLPFLQFLSLSSTRKLYFISVCSCSHRFQSKSSAIWKKKCFLKGIVASNTVKKKCLVLCYNNNKKNLSFILIPTSFQTYLTIVGLKFIIPNL